MTNKSCSTCKYCIFHDEGYSNYTVEGTYFNCFVNAHPDGQFDRWYGEDERLNYGATCAAHDEGDPVHIDVEEEDIESMSGEQQEMAIASIWTRKGIPWRYLGGF